MKATGAIVAPVLRSGSTMAAKSNRKNNKEKPIREKAKEQIHPAVPDQ
jgi:hypothetical protein